MPTSYWHESLDRASDPQKMAILEELQWKATSGFRLDTHVCGQIAIAILSLNLNDKSYQI